MGPPAFRHRSARIETAAAHPFGIWSTSSESFKRRVAPRQCPPGRLVLRKQSNPNEGGHHAPAYNSPRVRLPRPRARRHRHGGQRGGRRHRGPAFYVNGQLYRTVNTPTDLSKTGAPAHSFDSIYDFGGLQLNVATAAPGDPGYNGGRWMVRPVMFNTSYADAITQHDLNGSGNIDTNAELTAIFADRGCRGRDRRTGRQAVRLPGDSASRGRRDQRSRARRARDPPRLIS